MSKLRSRETKVCQGFVLKADAALGIIDAIVNVFGIVDDGDDVIHAGACTKTLSERGQKIRVRVLDHHNASSILDVLGKPLEMREVGRDELPPEVLADYPEATGGLWTQTQYAIETKHGLDAFNLIAGEFVAEYSIGFEALDVDYGKRLVNGKSKTVRNIRTIRLWEYSPVIWGMNPATATVDAKEQAAMTESTKETMPQGEVVRRMGDVLLGKLLQTGHGCINDWLTEGSISVEERSSAALLIEDAAMTVYNGLPPDFAARPMPDAYDPFMFLWEAVRELDTKAGRILSEANQGRIREAIQILQELLDSAAGESAEPPPDDASKAQAGSPSHEEAPTVDAQARRRQIETSLAELEGMRGTLA